MAEIAYYKDGNPYAADGSIIIVITGPSDNPTGGGAIGTGNYNGATSQSGHYLAKWSTENLKKSKAAQEKRVFEFNQLVKRNATLVQNMINKLKAATDKAVAAAQSGPSATDLAHQTNKDREAEALRASLWRKQKEAEEEKRKAEEAYKEAQKKYEEEQKKLAEEEKRLKEAEAEEKRIAGLSPEEQKVIYTERDVVKAKNTIGEKTKSLTDLNKKLTTNNTTVTNSTNSLKKANADLVKLKEEKVTADERVKRLRGAANDDVYKHRFIEACNYQLKVGKDIVDKEEAITKLKNQINTLTAENNKLKTDIATAKNNEANAKNEYNQQVVKLQKAKEELAIASLKSALDKAITFSENMSKYLNLKFKELAKEFEKLSTSKKIKGVDDALNKYEKFKTALNKKFSVKDRQAIANALKSTEYKEWAKQFDLYARGFKYTGNLSTAYDIAKDFTSGLETGNWKPFFLSAEKFLANKYVTGLLGGILTGLIVASLPVLAGAAQIVILELLIVAILDALIAPAIDKLSDVLAETVKSIP